MKPRQFEFHNPESVESALEMASQYEDEFIFYAGGTEVIIGMKERVIGAQHVINLKNIPDFGEITFQDGELHIGALVTHQDIADSELVKDVLPGYAELSNNVANIRVRNAGTLVGNLCFAEPNADPPALLAALGARAVLIGSQGLREVPIREFFEGPYCTVREELEFMTEVVIPLASEGCRAAYRKEVYLNRPSAGVASVRTMSNGIHAWEVWAGSVTGMPERLNRVCALLDETDAVDEAQVMAAAEQDIAERDVLEGVYGSETYRKHLVTVLAARSAKECVQ